MSADQQAVKNKLAELRGQFQALVVRAAPADHWLHLPCAATCALWPLHVPGEPG